MSDLMDRPLVSFVLPAYNEGKFIEDTLQKLDAEADSVGLHHEVIIVDDGSVDDTRSKALHYASRNSCIKVVGYNSNLGKGYAVRTGFLKAVGDAVVFVDSDLDVDVGQIKRYVDALKRGDIVIGCKWHPESVVDVFCVRRLLSYCFNFLARVFTGITVSDTQTGIKAVRRKTFCEVFRRLSVKRYAFDVELLVLAKLYNLKAVELPVRLKLKSWFRLREAWHMLLDLLGIAYRLRVKKWYKRAHFQDSNP